MNLKKYIVIGLKPQQLSEELQVKVIEGFFRDSLESSIDIEDQWIPKNDGTDKLYFLPGCSVPRFKVREKFICTIKPEYATAAFINKEGLTGSGTMFMHHKDVVRLSKDMENFIRLFVDHLRDINVSMIIKSLMQNPSIKGVALTQELYQRSYLNSFLKATAGANLYDFLEEQPYAFRRNLSGTSAYQLLEVPKTSKLNRFKCGLFPEEDILRHLNKGKLVLDDKKYHELKAFGETKEDANVTLMMELMSNSDFEKSVDKLVFLIAEFKDQIVKAPGVDHVNFKSLMSFLKLHKRDLKRFSIHKVTAILRQHKKFTKANAFLLSMLYSGKNVNVGDTGNICWEKKETVVF